MRFKRNLILFFIFLSIAAFLLYIFSDRVIIYGASKMYNLDISYKSFKMASFKEFEFRDMSFIAKRFGLGLFSKYATINLVREKVGGPSIEFCLRDVRFIRDEREKAAGYDTLSGLVSAPFNSSWSYKEISGRLRPSKKSLSVEKLTATSDEIRLLFTGDLYYDKTLKSDITIYFSDKLIEKIPPELSNVVLRDEQDRWKSLSVSLNGDYKSPSIQVMGKLFRLNIGTAADTKKPSGIDF